MTKAAFRAGSAIALFLLPVFCAFAQKHEYVTWTVSTDSPSVAPGGTVLLRIAGRIDSGWHLYSASTLGGIPTSFQAGPETVIESQRLLQPAPKRAFDKNFGLETETFEGEVAFLLELHIRKDAPAGPVDLTLRSRYQTCNDTQCVPGRWTGTANLKIDPAAAAAAIAIPSGYAEGKPPAPDSAQAPASGQDQGIGAFLLVAFGFGLLSIFTPCVFPMIPITMSYFLNQQTGGRRDSVVQAIVFCLGIIVLFSGIGLLITAALGPFGVVQLGSNRWVNGFISVLFIAFGLSLLGAFEITIPSSILTRLNRSSEKGGFGGTLLMGLTFSLASFACVGPFVGTLLAASVGGGGSRPVFGMLTFATGLALPFFVLALFPSYLKKMPRSGGWLARVKVVMGFVILAFSLKYLSSLDQVMQWGLLTRGRFLAAWVVLFSMAGLYLLGYVRLEGIKPDESMGLGRLLSGMAFLIFAISLLPGMFGGRLGDLDAYVPVAGQESGGLAGGGSETALVWMKNQYRDALDRARREGKLVFVNFTGYACANCHWMKANMFTRPEIAAALKGFILVDLYADGTDQASIDNQNLELAKFQTIAEPFYAIMDPDEKVIATFPGLTKDPQEFSAFLAKGASGAPSSPAPVNAATPAPTSGQDSSLPHVNKLEGGALDTAALGGKVVVVNFWATWCVPCIEEIPTFNKLRKEFGAKGVEVVGVSMDQEGAERVRPFLKKHEMNYTVALGSDAISDQFKLTDLLPVTVVFDRSGKQVKRFDGLVSAADLQSTVEHALL
ncbi:MAG TPA: cytochrome c biogenesis protein CcdA [Bryobacteraceae bacterium]|nr:cytochrome c biogenesis protein CcdA [Bryobacteraceae bacterium]